MTGRHVQLRLIGDPAQVAEALAAIAAVVDLTAGRGKPTRDGDGQVIKYATLTARKPRPRPGIDVTAGTPPVVRKPSPRSNPSPR